MSGFQYLYDRQPVENLAKLCRRFPPWQFKSSFRSTVPLLSLVDQGRDVWNALMAPLGVPADAPVHIEYGVVSPKAGGKPSQTDAMIVAPNVVVGVEAKWTEPREKPVSKRIAQPESDGGDPRDTVRGWLARMQPFACAPLEIDAFLDVPYQVVHRIASACTVATERNVHAEVVYLHFSPSPDAKSATPDDYVRDLQAAKAAMGGVINLGLTFVDMHVTGTAAFERIKQLDKRDPKSAPVVVEALCGGPLFVFEPQQTIRI